MPKALFFNVPGHGHVNPSLPLVAELVRRGDHITYFITSQFRAGVEAAGAEFRPYSAIHDDFFSGPGLDGTRPFKAANLLITTAEAVLPELLETVRAAQPDYILFDGMCPWGYLVARILRIPAVASLSLMPLGSPRTMMSWPALRVMLPMVLRNVDEGLAAARRSRALGKRYNVAPIGLASILNTVGDVSLSYTSPYFHPAPDTVSPTVRFVGWTLRETPAHEPFPFGRTGGRRLIYVSLGTLVNKAPAFFRACIDAFAGGDDHVVISTGHGVSPEAFGTLPANITVAAWVPQVDVLKQAALFITHGGMGSVHDGLYLGIPLLLVPQQGEQSMNALRVAELGAGLMLTQPQVNAATLRAAAARLLAEPNFAATATRIGDSFRAAGGMPRAADEVETLLRTRTGVEAH